MHRIKTVSILTIFLLLLGACSENLSETQWVLTDIAGESVPLSGNAYLRFHENGNGSVEGSGGCNRFSGQYKVEGEKLHVGPLISTRMACPDMREERAFFDALQSADAYRLQTGELVLLRGGKPLLRFKAKQSAEGAE